MNSQSIEFQKILKNYDSSENIRNFFRIPIKGMENIHVLINNIQYNVLDISPGGVAIILEDNAIFTINEIIENCELCIHDQVFHSLKARIVHSSLGMEMSIQCGVQWIDLDRQISDHLNQIILTMKNQLLKKI
jgi:c-di-GMP-binding flagellar brake protein YcgR